ncbi:MAG: hydrogenase 3 maturation endopeptidase HyCI [Candidatus Thorarchaeota archaeon]|jgi:hydrogenase 3 maturation protease
MVRTIANFELAGDVKGLGISEELKNFISDAKRIAILGIGNDLRTDDGVGLFIISGLKTTSPDLFIENVGSVPEAFARPLADFGADRVIMVDAADMRKPAGHVELVTKTRIGGIALSTHSMPLSFLMQYLEDATGGQTILLGIQPQSIVFGEGLTSEIKEVAQKVISTLDAILESHFRG